MKILYGIFVDIKGGSLPCGEKVIHIIHRLFHTKAAQKPPHAAKFGGILSLPVENSKIFSVT
ncbi:MAG: hypothetical protein II727_03610 [Oscillospiraceae bacterium]|nr:hypothetical protein [Oscillospiraceae bacterium]